MVFKNYYFVIFNLFSMRFKLGDQVMLASGWGDIGTIEQIHGDISVYIVSWKNRWGAGAYTEKELSPVDDDDSIAPIRVPKEKTNNLTF